MTCCRVALVAFLFSLLPAVDSIADDTWTAFQNGGRPVLGENVLPTHWSPDEGIRWKIGLAGYGQSSPVVFSDQVYVTSVSGGKKENLHVQAFAISTGEQIWQHDAKNSSPEENTSYVSRAAPTPVCDADGVITFFEGGNIVALSHEGEVRWEIDLVAEYGDVKARHGIAASLEQNEECIFVWVEREKDPYVMAVRKTDGKSVWREDGAGATSWASPRLIPVGDDRHLVLSGSGKIVGLDPATGSRLWEFDDLAGNTTPTPISAGNGRFLTGASPGNSEQDGGNAARSNGVVQIRGNKQDGFSAAWLWRAKRASCSFGSPMTYENKAWFVNRQGVVFCLDLETGEELFAGRSPGKSIWATPIAAGEHIYLFGKEGATTVLKSSDEMKVVATNELWTSASQDSSAPGSSGAPVLYAATPHRSTLLLRRGDILYAVGE